MENSKIGSQLKYYMRNHEYIRLQCKIPCPHSLFSLITRFHLTPLVSWSAFAPFSHYDQAPLCAHAWLPSGTTRLHILDHPRKSLGAEPPGRPRQLSGLALRHAVCADHASLLALAVLSPLTSIDLVMGHRGESYSSNTPMHILVQERHHIICLQTLTGKGFWIMLRNFLAALNPLNQMRRERYHVRNKQRRFRLSLAVTAAAAHRIRREDDVDAGEAWVLRPFIRVLAEVADEDEDLKGAVESESR
jgi:hypothetical protein